MLGKMEGKRRSRQAVGDRLVGIMAGKGVFQKKQMVSKVSAGRKSLLAFPGETLTFLCFLARDKCLFFFFFW